MSRKERVRQILPGLEVIEIPNPMVAERFSAEEFDARVSREEFDNRIAESIEKGIRQITESSLGRWQAELQNIDFDDNCLTVSIEVPFVLPADPHYRRDYQSLQEKFAEYLFKRDNQKRLSNQVLYPMLVDFLIKEFRLKTNPRIMKRLRKLPQRSLAGRPTQPIPSEVQVRITQEGKAILGMLRVIRGQIQEWQKKTPDLEDSAIQQKLLRKYPPSKFKWIPDFLKMDSKLPRRRYEASARNRAPAMEVTSPDAKPCKITEPRDWSVVDIATRVTQSHILQETGKRIPLLRIKALLK